MDKHTIFYDAECPICIREIALILEDNRAEYFKAVAIQGNEEILKQYGITAEDALTYLHILRNDGVMLGKMPAVRLMYRGFKGFALVKLANLLLLDRLAAPATVSRRGSCPVRNAKTAYAASNL